MNSGSVGPNEIDLIPNSRIAWIVGCVIHSMPLLIAGGCLASLVAGPEDIVVRLIAGAFGLLVVSIYVRAWAGRHRLPSKMVVDHEGIRLRNLRGKVFLRLAWSELSGVGVMTNEVRRYRQQRDLLTGRTNRYIVGVPTWLELYPADAGAVARHPELETAWTLGRYRADGEQQRWLVNLGDGRWHSSPVGDLVQRWRPQLWRGHRSGSVFFPGAHQMQLNHLARRGYDLSPR